MDAQKVVLITGASSGIGQATARLLGREGYFVALAARRRDRLEALAGELGERGLPLQCDVTDDNQVRAAVQELLDRWGRIDVLINNAGVMRIGPFLDQPGMVRTELHPRAEFEQAIRAAGIEKPLEAEEIASAILYTLQQPEHVAISEIMVRPVTQEL